jgi:exopolysaccharide biosynthesis WecB/TagA/CpsF family protein
VSEGVRNWIAEYYPTILISGYRDGYFSAQQEPGVIRDIAQSSADLLLVALGVPQQELWIARHLSATGVRVAMGVGGFSTSTLVASRVPLNGCARWVLNGCTDCIRSLDVCGGGTCLATLFSCTGC